MTWHVVTNIFYMRCMADRNCFILIFLLKLGIEINSARRGRVIALDHCVFVLFGQQQMS